MSVYVDLPLYRFGRMIMCHMVADDLEELHAMADRIGVARRHFQEDTGRPHYDICKAKRALAIQHGAQEVTARELVGILKRNREDTPNDQ